MNKTYTFDIETYQNYTLFAFRNIEDHNDLITIQLKGAETVLSNKKKKKIKELFTHHKIITFNGLKFDEPVTAYAMLGKNAKQIYAVVKKLIEDDVSSYKLYRQFKLQAPIKDHIDIMDVAKGQASLKEYGARLSAKKLQDLPYEPTKILSKKEMREVKKYCVNDLALTELLYKFLKSDLDLRESLGKQYDMNLMSMKAAKIADLILAKECGFSGKAPSAPEYVSFKCPKYIEFQDPRLKSLLKRIKSYKFEVTDRGNVVLPAFLTEKFEFDGLMYQFGIGGLHASVSNTTIQPSKKETILDIDYKSLYPSIIIKNNFPPKHLGKDFVDTYQMMFDKRNKELKPAMKLCEYGSDEYNDLNNQQNGMKLILNSSFGKTGERFAKIFDLNTMLNTTLTGQLTLMMVVEKLYLEGFHTFYANTDGITLKVKKKDVDKVKQITADFDKVTGLEMEYDEFKACHIRDVNNFINIPIDGKPKRKGTFAEIPQIDKNTQVPIVFDAVAQYLFDGTKIEDTIKSCEEVYKFCSSRKVTGGAMYTTNIPEMYPEGWDDSLKRNKRITQKMQKLKEKLEAQWVQLNGLYLGKVVRWYYAINGTTMHYKKSGNKVPMTDGVKPMMNLTKKIPIDLNYEWYFDYAKRMLSDLGVEY